MREVEFRGIDTLTGNWVYGAYLKHQEYMPYPIGHVEKDENYIHLILASEFADWGMKRGIDCHVVHKESVGQYTGFKDKNGKKIFEGDIIEFIHNNGSVAKDYVMFENGRFTTGLGYNIHYFVMRRDGVKVIGNVYQDKGYKAYIDYPDGL